MKLLDPCRYMTLTTRKVKRAWADREHPVPISSWEPVHKPPRLTWRATTGAPRVGATILQPAVGLVANVIERAGISTALPSVQLAVGLSSIRVTPSSFSTRMAVT